LGNGEEKISIGAVCAPHNSDRGSNSFKKNEILGERFRLKTLNYRGQISQGLVQPLSILPEGNYELGNDVTALLGIRKWEVEERAG
jgi:hypothetical protein